MQRHIQEILISLPATLLTLRGGGTAVAVNATVSCKSTLSVNKHMFVCVDWAYLTSWESIFPSFYAVFPQTMIKTFNMRRENLGRTFLHIRINGSLWRRQTQRQPFLSLFLSSQPIHPPLHNLLIITLTFVPNNMPAAHFLVALPFRSSICTCQLQLISARVSYLQWLQSCLHPRLPLQLHPPVFSHVAQTCVHLSAPPSVRSLLLLTE